MKAFLKRRWGESTSLAQLLARRWYVAVPVLAGYAYLHHHIHVNLTPSLPYTLVWLDHGATPKRGDLVVYRYAGTPLPDFGYLDGVRFFKRVAGMPGDAVTVSDRVVSVAGTEIGYAKPRTRAGQPLEVIASGTIPEGQFFAQADSPDSFDSRYASAGLVPLARVLGVARPIL